MTRRALSRRLMLAGAAAMSLRGVPARGATLVPVALQLSWLPSVQFGGSYIAQRHGYWASQGLDVSLLSGGPNAPVEPAVVSGAALVGISAADFAAAAVFEGAPFRIIAVGMQRNPFAIVSLPARPVLRPQDLAGRRLGMATANMPVLQAVCTANGIDIGAIDIVPTQYDAAPLVAGQVDALLCWRTDLPVAMAARGIPSVVRMLEDFGYRLQSQTYIALDSAIAKRRGEVLGLLRGELHGWQDFRRDTDAAAALAVSLHPDAGLDPAIQRAEAKALVDVMFSNVTDANGFGWFTDESVDASIRTLRLLGQTVTPSLWDRSLLEEIRRDG